jgi:hypothetical protein
MQDNIKEKYSVLNLETKENDTARIRLTIEPWNDIMYSYGEVKFEEDEEERGHLHFDYKVHDPEDFDIKLYNEEEQNEFQTLLGDILVDIMQVAIAHMESKDDREDNTGELDTE